MSPWTLTLLTALLLTMPLLLLHSRGPRSEVHGYLRPLWWINVLYCGFLHRLESRWPAPLPEHGPAILIANHTCGVDHLVLQASCRRILGFMIAQEFYDVWICKPFCKLIGC